MGCWGGRPSADIARCPDTEDWLRLSRLCTAVLDRVLDPRKSAVTLGGHVESVLHGLGRVLERVSGSRYLQHEIWEQQTEPLHCFKASLI
jgi:hypothetical protein